MTKPLYALAGVFALVVGLSGAPASARAEVSPVPLTILHTNDLHSHLRAEKDELGIGGVARLKTAITRERAKSPHTLLLDGGDWSEGSVYYIAGAGAETVRLLESLTYDALVVGNHDWYNGVDVLLDMLEKVDPKMTLLATNVETGAYRRQDEFHRRIPPYVIKEVGGVKVALMGLLTYEFIYDSFFEPIKIKQPFSIARELARQLKKKADVVIAISHNGIKTNKGILLAAPEIDLVVGGHDHAKLTKPVVVERPGGKPAWIVEAGSWGHFLGRVDLKVTPRDPRNAKSKPTVELVRYGLTQMDSTIPEDEETLKRIASIEAWIEAKKGPIFSQVVGHSEIELGREGQEHLIGNFSTDAYRAVTGADLALDQTALIYGEIHEGPVTTVDVFNSNPGIYHPIKEKAWTLHTIPIRGRSLSWLLNLLYTAKGLSQRGALSFSGVDIVYSPLAVQSEGQIPKPFETFGELGSDPTANGISIHSLLIQGKPIEENRTYQVAAPGGVVLALEFLKSLLPGAIPMDQMRDTGLEDWRIMADYLAAKSPVNLADIHYGRVHTAVSDLGMLFNDVRWEPLGLDSQGQMRARIVARITNTGMKPSAAGTREKGARLALLFNEHGTNYAIDPKFRQAAEPMPLPELRPGQSTEVSWDSVMIPNQNGRFAITARLEGNDGEINRSNDWVTRHFFVK